MIVLYIKPRGFCRRLRVAALRLDRSLSGHNPAASHSAALVAAPSRDSALAHVYCPYERLALQFHRLKNCSWDLLSRSSSLYHLPPEHQRPVPTWFPALLVPLRSAHHLLRALGVENSQRAV